LQGTLETSCYGVDSKHYDHNASLNEIKMWFSY